MLGYFVVSIVHQTLTWTTGSLTCVCDMFACVYTWGTLFFGLIWRTFVRACTEFDSGEISGQQFCAEITQSSLMTLCSVIVIRLLFSCLWKRNAVVAKQREIQKSLLSPKQVTEFSLLTSFQWVTFFSKHRNMIVCNCFCKLFPGYRFKPEYTTNCQLSATTTSLTHRLPIFLTSLCMSLPGSFILLQTHRCFVSHM